MALRNLKFFDKSGNLISPSIKNEIFSFDIFFDKTSTGLFDSQHLFLLEEILHETEKSLANKYKFEPPKNTLDIQILSYLADYNGMVSKEILGHQFPHLNLEKDYINEFVANYSIYVEKTFGFEGGFVTEFYFINETGKNFVADYQDNLREFEYSNYNILPEYVRPRSSYSQKINDDSEEYYDDTFLFFKWANTKSSKNIFLYLIDYNPDSLYTEKGNSLCFENNKTFPTIVPVYDEYLSPTENNPNWKLWFAPYKFDDGRGDSYEYNRTPLWTQEGYVDNISYPKVYDKYGIRVFPGRRLLNSESILNKKPFQFNFALHSEAEGEFTRTLEIYAIKTNNVSVEIDGEITYQKSQSVYQIAEVNFYGEVVAEDERLEILLENFGRSVDESELPVFRDVDIDEERTDFIRLNEKRKELLLASNDIFPYLGSYRTFVNALKFFGFHDIRLKEYFINTVLSSPKDGQIYYSSVEIPMDLKVIAPKNQTKDFNDFVYGELVDNELYYKSSRFGLFYNITELTGDVDSDGYPITTDAFQFTNEEILIKLYGLKKLLEEKYLPHHVRIINITGEGIYFAKIGLNSWQDLNPIISIRRETNPNFIASPLKGYIKSLDALLNIFRKKVKALDDVGYFDRNGNYIYEGITEFTKLENIIHCSLYEFIKNGDIDFPYDNEVTLSIIEKFYPNYFELKKEIYNHLHSVCDTRLNKEEITEAVIHSIKMLGQPVVIRLLDIIVTWNDLTVPFEYKENDFWGTAQSLDVSFDDIGKYSGYEMDWVVEHEDGSYCYRKTGKIDDIRDILVFLPKVGFYNVTCVIRDNTNFPAITKRVKYIEVLDREPDIIAFGRCVNPEHTIKDTNAKWDEFEGSWDIGSFCPIPTSWDDAKISWDSLFYENYLNQDFVTYTEQPIMSIDYEKNIIELTGSDFYENWINKKQQFYKPEIILEKAVENFEEKFNFSIDTFTLNNKINVPGFHPLKTGDKINVHKYYKHQNFVITDGGQLLLTTIDWKEFIIGKSINLYTTDNILYQYDILDVEVNLPKNLITVDLTDDGSLTELTFSYIEYNTNEMIFDVIGVEHIEENTIIEISDNNKYLVAVRNEIKANPLAILDWKIDYCFLTGYYPFDVIDCSLNTNGNTSIWLANNSNWCNIDIRFLVKYSDHDIHWAVRNESSEMYFWENLDTVKFEDTKYQSWDMMEYYQEPLLGFKITDYRDKGTITFDDYEWSYDISNSDFNDKWFKLCELLNESTEKYVSLFNYTVIDNTYIQATARTYGNHTLMNLSSSLGTVVTPSTYPLMYFNEFEEQFFNGDNNPANWHINKRTLTSNENLKNGIVGAFNFSDMFIAYKEVNIPIFTTLFMVYDKYKNNIPGNTFAWELWDEKNKILLAKSNYNYIIWNFVDEGVYSVKITVTDSNGNKYSKIKQSWITVTKNL